MKVQSSDPAKIKRIKISPKHNLGFSRDPGFQFTQWDFRDGKQSEGQEITHYRVCVTHPHHEDPYAIAFLA